MKKDFCKFKKGLLLSGVALILSTFSVQAMEEQREDELGHKITNSGKGTLEVFSDETLVHILSFLTPQDLATVTTLSKEMKMLSEDDLIWKPIAGKQGTVLDPTSQISVKNQVREGELGFERQPQITYEELINPPPHRKVTVQKLLKFSQSTPREVSKSKEGYEFQHKNRSFILSISNPNAYKEYTQKEHLKRLHPSAYTSFVWDYQSNKWWSTIYLNVNGHPCHPNQNLQDKVYLKNICYFPDPAKYTFPTGLCLAIEETK